jgi:energy-coupling factor transport system ATP-binding protein
MKLTPVAFEKMIIDLLQKMGYGSFENAGRTTPISADEGIDGIIMEDKLGFNLIYIQAKHWERDRTVGRPEIQSFVGAISGKGGNGLFVTTAKYAKTAIDYAEQHHIILIDGKRLDKYKSSELFKGMMAMLPQDPQSLFVHKTVKEDLGEMISSKDASKEEKIRNVAEICEITELLESHPYDLSGGEQQRAALAKVLLTEPKILLLDEPTKGIDSFFKLKFAEIMNKLKAQGVTIIMVSHDVEFCAKYADTVSMFFDGGIVTTNTPNRFFSGNSFYTTAANRMSRHLFENSITNEDVITLCQQNL